MNIGFIVEPNSKGQIVIPKKIREQLNITEKTSLNVVADEEAIHIHPIKDVSTTSDVLSNNKMLLEVLRKTQGAWAKENWDEYDKQEKKRRRKELNRTKNNKKAW